MKKERNLTIDLIKSFLIVLVVFGHCIQYGSGADIDYFGNTVFKIIYSFHMPLFAMISGYFIAFSLKKRSWIDCIKSKIKTLFVPIISWGFISAILFFLTSGNILKAESSILYYIKIIVWNVINGQWFLWAVFLISFIVIITKQFFKDSILIYLIIFTVTFVTPDGSGAYLYKFIYPFFIIGYLFNKEGIYEKHKKICDSWITVALFGSLFCCLLPFYNKETYIYTSMYSVLKENPLHQLYIDFFRMFIGFLGSVFVVLLLRKISVILPKKALSLAAYPGKETMGIYIISGLLNANILIPITSGFNGINYLITVFETISVIVVSLIAIRIIHVSKITDTLLLGGR